MFILVKDPLDRYTQAMKIDEVTGKPMPVFFMRGGGEGGEGMAFLHGEGPPESSTGKDGDVYLDTTNGDLYKKQGEWEDLINLVGPAGEQGTPGTNGTNGSQGPKGDPGNDGVSVTGVTLEGGVFIFTMSDGSTHDVPLPE